MYKPQNKNKVKSPLQRQSQKQVIVIDNNKQKNKHLRGNDQEECQDSLQHNKNNRQDKNSQQKKIKIKNFNKLCNYGKLKPRRHTYIDLTNKNTESQKQNISITSKTHSSNNQYNNQQIQTKKAPFQFKSKNRSLSMLNPQIQLKNNIKHVLQKNKLFNTTSTQDKDQQKNAKLQNSLQCQFQLENKSIENELKNSNQFSKNNEKESKINVEINSKKLADLKNSISTNISSNNDIENTPQSKNAYHFMTPMQNSNLKYDTQEKNNNFSYQELNNHIDLTCIQEKNENKMSLFYIDDEQNKLYQTQNLEKNQSVQEIIDQVCQNSKKTNIIFLPLEEYLVQYKKIYLGENIYQQRLFKRPYLYTFLEFFKFQYEIIPFTLQQDQFLIKKVINQINSHDKYIKQLLILYNGDQNRDILGFQEEQSQKIIENAQENGFNCYIFNPDQNEQIKKFDGNKNISLSKKGQFKITKWDAQIGNKDSVLLDFIYQYMQETHI